MPRSYLENFKSIFVLREFLAYRKLSKTNKEFKMKLREILGFYPADLSLYQVALTHKSASYTLNGEKVNNERLEFLGDSILDAVISDYLYKTYPNEREGFLTEMRSKIVNGEKLKELAVQIKLDQFIIQKNSMPATSSRIFEDAFEALIGAIYIDKGYWKVYGFISEKIIEKHIDLKQLENINQNYKSQLIEWSQKTKNQIEFTSSNEFDNLQLFSSVVKHNDIVIGIGKGTSKKEAEQNAACEALISLKEI
jgi:ribonuclease-3